MVCGSHDRSTRLGLLDQRTGATRATYATYKDMLNRRDLRGGALRWVARATRRPFEPPVVGPGLESPVRARGRSRRLPLNWLGHVDTEQIVHAHGRPATRPTPPRHLDLISNCHADRSTSSVVHYICVAEGDGGMCRAAPPTPSAQNAKHSGRRAAVDWACPFAQFRQA